MIGKIMGLQKVERIPTGDVTDLKVKTGNGKLTISWGEPKDTNWKKTKLVMKQGSYPQNAIDGAVLVVNEEKDKYKTAGFEVNDLVNGETYYFQLFTYSNENVVNKNDVNRITGTPQPYKIMTAVIDLTNSDPATCVSYGDDAIGMIAKSDEWDKWFGEYPCLFKEGKEVGKLNPNNFAQFEDGTEADITSGEAGDVMIAFPRRGLKIETSEDGNTCTVSMTDNPDDENFKYYAHSRGETRKDVFYLGAYKGCVLDGKLRSISGIIPSTSRTIEEFRGCAHANGMNYEQSAFYQLTYRQAMYILKYVNLNSQETVGMGFVGGSSTQRVGATDAVGMNYGTDSTTSRVKTAGIEDSWGNISEWIEGIICLHSGNVLIGNDNFNNTGSGYLDLGTIVGSTDSHGYMTKPIGTTQLGFIAKTIDGISSKRYFCDYTYISRNRICEFGGSWNFRNNTDYIGIFNMYINNDFSTVTAFVGARLMYL